MSVDAALYAVSGAVSACSLALVIASRIIERRAKQSADRDEGGWTAQPRQEGVGDEGTSEPDERPPKQTGEAPKSRSEPLRLTVTSTLMQVMQSMDKTSFAELAAYITRIAQSWARGEVAGTVYGAGGHAKIYTISVRLQGQPYRLVFKPITAPGGGSELQELQLLDLLARSDLPDNYVSPEPTDDREDFDKVIVSSFSPVELAILRGATTNI